MARRIPPGFVSPEAAAAVGVDVASLVSEFDSNYGRGRLKNQCRVCDNGCAELVNALLARGAGGSSISTFLHDKKFGEISESAIDRHKKLHRNGSR